MQKMIERPHYLDQLIAFKDTQIIKAVTGIRRCGKSTLFDLYCDYLRANGTKEKQIIRINGLFIKKNCDVYITGSNAYLLSGELATLLSGRYVEIKMLPLSYREYISAFPDRTDLMIKYRDYIQNGSFPYILNLKRRQDIRTYLEGIYTTVVLKDIVARKNISDVDILENVISYMFDNIGNLCSANKIANTLTSSGRKVSAHSVDTHR